MGASTPAAAYRVGAVAAGCTLLGAVLSAVFEGSSLERAAKWAFVTNGPTSIAAALVTAFEPGWELSALGMISFAVWNLLVVAMTILATVAFRRRLAAAVASQGR